VKPLVRALYSAGSFVGERNGAWLFSVPNEAHGAKCEEHRATVEAALAATVGGPVTIEFVAGGAPVHDTPRAPEPTPAARPSAGNGGDTSPSTESSSRAGSSTEAESVAEPAPYVPEADEDVDLHELTDAPPESVKTPIDRLAEAFPGSELMSDDR
jgi:DNA polymerase-3 subunit gamma/tau